MRGHDVMVEVDHSQRRIITRTTGALVFAIRYIRLTWRSSPAKIVPLSCAARIAITISSWSRSPAAISTRNLWRSTAAITERNTRILDRGTGIASYNEAQVLTQRG
jgi:hypothetical protein